MTLRCLIGGGLAVVLLLTGCTASHTQITQSVQRSPGTGESLGRVALFTLVSPKQPRFSHEKAAAKFRDVLQASLEKTNGNRVVLSRQIPTTIVPKDVSDRLAAAVPYCQQEAQRAGADAICLVHFKDVGGDLTLGLGIPKMSSIGGQCDYDLVVLDGKTGQELLSSSGKWSDRIELVVTPQLPSAGTLAENVAQVLRPASTSDAQTKPINPLALSDRY